MATEPASGSVRAGLCSVTLRAQTVAEVAALAATAGLTAIEWGGDVHVPAGDDLAAAEARRCAEDAGLTVVSYGSYLSCTPNVDRHVGPVLDTTEALGTRAVRVWCPPGIEPGARAEDRAAVADAVAAVAVAAEGRGIDVYLEFHGGTITATAASTVALLDAVDAPNLFTAWQPPYWAPQGLDADLDDLRSIGSRLAHVHVYEWEPDGRRHSLAAGADAWPARLELVGSIPVGGDHRAFPRRTALLEFVADDDPAALIADAATLTRWVGATTDAPAADGREDDERP